MRDNSTDEQAHGEIREVLALNLKHALSAKKLSQSDLHQKSGIPLTTINNIVNARYTANVQLIADIASALSMSLSALLLKDRNITELVDNYEKSSSLGKKVILAVSKAVLLEGAERAEY